MIDFKGTIYPIAYPSGGFGFVGAVPGALAYVMRDGSPMSAEFAHKVAMFGPSLFKGEIKAVSFVTESDALDAAVKLGYRAVTSGMEKSKGMQKGVMT